MATTTPTHSTPMLRTLDIRASGADVARLKAQLRTLRYAVDRGATYTQATHHAELGTLYSPSFFHAGIAVHGAPSVLARPASHGCVRIPMHLAQPIQDAMRAGSQVQVRP